MIFNTKKIEKFSRVQGLYCLMLKVQHRNFLLNYCFFFNIRAYKAVVPLLQSKIFSKLHT